MAVVEIRLQDLFYSFGVNTRGGGSCRQCEQKRVGFISNGRAREQVAFVYSID